MDVRESANRREVFRSAAQDLLELDDASSNSPTSMSARPSVTRAEMYEGCRCSPARQVSIASANMPEAAVFLGERREGDRRRVPLDPALQFLESRCVGHDCSRYGMIVHA